MVSKVVVTRQAQRDLRRAPRHIVRRLQGWVHTVQTEGLAKVRRIPGYHDEPLQGQRAGQRSVRLNRQWRAIYVLEDDGDITFISVEEVTPHDY